MAKPLLPPDLLAMMKRGVSTIVASRDAQLRPSIMRAMASSIDDAGGVTVYLSRAQSRQLLQDIAATGHIAAVFSEPSTHRTVQLKATRCDVRSATASDAPALSSYLASMEHELQQVSIPPHLTRVMLAHRLDDMVAVSFQPEHAFDQTPGPQAGTRIAGTTP